MGKGLSRPFPSVFITTTGRRGDPDAEGGEAALPRSALARERGAVRRDDRIQFRLPYFAANKHQNFEYKFRFTQNKTCRGTIGEQLLQRPTYLLINVLSINFRGKCHFSRLGQSANVGVDRIFAHLPLKISNSTNY
jgi:hypothetical protein